jgi:hypothetical protein
VGSWYFYGLPALNGSLENKVASTTGAKDYRKKLWHF